MERDVCPITPLHKTPAVKRGDHRTRCCEHGEWTFAGADYRRKRRSGLPGRGIPPASRWVKADRLHPLSPRHTARATKLYHSRGASSASSAASSMSGRCCRCASVALSKSSFMLTSRFSPSCRTRS